MAIKPIGLSIEQSDLPNKYTIEFKADGLARMVHVLSYFSLGVSEKGTNLLGQLYGEQIKESTSRSLKKLKIDAPADQVVIAWDPDTIYGTYFNS